MKKYLYSALALPLLFACSSDDLIEKEMISNDQFAGIEKVNATFYMDEERPVTRMDKTGWTLENGDLYGFAWLTDAHEETGYTTIIPIDGNAYQNHNLIQTNGRFEPQTSIYVGKYYIYRPYDETTVSPQAINFNSLVDQPLAEGYESAKQPWKDLAKSAIIIGDKWTEILPAGRTYGTDLTKWDKPGIGQPYKVFAAVFSNQTGLDLTYKKNNPTFAADKAISGATDINHTYAKGTAVGAADIYEVKVGLAGAAKSFTYAPTVEPNDGVYPQTVGGKTVYHNGDFWATKKNLAAVTAGNPGDGFTFTNGDITLTPADAVNGISTGDNGSKDWFWFNSLPVTDGTGALATTKVTTTFTTSYGIVTVDPFLKDCAYVLDKFNNDATSVEWIKLVAGDASKDKATSNPKEWGFDAHNTFVNQYGNHKGKYAFDVDFSTGVMNNMHIKSDAQLQKLLKYYLASGKTETVRLNLDAASATDKTFKLSKISIALIQTINTTVGFDKVLIKACGTHGSPKIIITQDGQADLGLADKKEVPALNGVFQTVGTNVFLSKDCEWTWGGGADGKTALPVDAAIASITNEGTLTVNATNIAMAKADETLQGTLANAAGATMNITKVTTVKNALTNLGTIEVGSTSNTTAELRAYGVAINNDATDATDLTKRGTINNYGVVGSSDGIAGSEVNNYGEINVMNAAAITLLKSNELNTPAFSHAFTAGTYMMGSVVIPSPFALVSVSNGAENGFIKYTWPAATTTYATPTGGVVKYNTIVVSGDITFTEAEPEIQYIEFNGTRTQVINPTNPADDTDMGHLTKLKGIIVNGGKSIIIEKNNGMNCTIGAFLGTGATIYKGGNFKYPAGATTNYFGTWTADQVVVW